ncbi:MAG TPA: kelch repeat-containing protein [Candidatus Limnocylindria bacterium]
MPRTPTSLPAVALLACLVAACSVQDPPTPTASPTLSGGSSRAAAPPSGSPTAGPSTGEGVARAWERLPDAPFARLEMAVTAHEGRIWLAGGLSALGDALIDVDVFDPATGAWSEGPSLPAPVHHAALVSNGGELVLIGGYQGSDFNRPTDLVLVLADGDDAWREAASLPEPRAAGAAAWDGSRIVYAGGVGADGVAADVYARAGDAWERIGSMAQTREHLAAASDGEGTVWLLGGRVGSLTTNLAVVELVSGSSINSIGSLPTARGGVAAFHDPARGACLSGGEAPEFAFTTVECIDADGATVTLAELNEPHHGHGSAVVDGVAYVILGGPEPTLSAGATVESLALGP